MVKKKEEKKTSSRTSSKPETIKLVKERDIAMDFAGKVYKKFNEMIKSVVLFGSSAKQVSTSDSDVDIIIIIDDVAIQWDNELVAWYREELAKLIKQNPYKKSLHINTVKLSTWWQDLIRGDPIVVNILRYGDALIDFGGFFNPLKVLLKNGKIKSTPEAIYTLLQRAPTHLARANAALLGVVDGLYWACVDSAHAAIIAADITPASPEHISDVLKENFVNKKMLKDKFVNYYVEIHNLAKQIVHGKKVEIDGKYLDELRTKSEEFVSEMGELVDDLIKMKE